MGREREIKGGRKHSQGLMREEKEGHILSRRIQRLVVLSGKDVLAADRPAFAPAG